MVWHPEWLTVSLAVGLSGAGFLLYYLLVAEPGFRKLPETGHKNEWIRWVLRQRLGGFVLLGLLPVIPLLLAGNATLADIGWAAPAKFDFLAILVGIPVIVGFNYLVNRKGANAAVYPQIRLNHWTANLILFNGITWTAYLAAYETLFRGLLLLIPAGPFGTWPAILMNTTVYALAHIYKGRKEVAGAVPFGLLLCLLTLQSGTVWIPFILHLAMALSTEHFSLRANPEMSHGKK